MTERRLASEIRAGDLIATSDGSKRVTKVEPSVNGGVVIHLEHGDYILSPLHPDEELLLAPAPAPDLEGSE